MSTSDSSPAPWPSVLARPRRCAHRPLPSITTATCWGTRGALQGRQESAWDVDRARTKPSAPPEKTFRRHHVRSSRGDIRSRRGDALRGTRRRGRGPARRRRRRDRRRARAGPPRRDHAATCPSGGEMPRGPARRWCAASLRPSRGAVTRSSRPAPAWASHSRTSCRRRCRAIASSSPPRPRTSRTSSPRRTPPR